MRPFSLAERGEVWGETVYTSSCVASKQDRLSERLAGLDGPIRCGW